MKNIACTLTLAFLAAGCATPVALQGSRGAEAVAGELKVAWLRPYDVEIVVEGKPYRGEFNGEVCHTAECRGAFRNVLRHHRRHIRHGETVLAAPDGATLKCVWVSHLPELDGTCETPDGRKYLLKGE